jgi:hypothetical protein
MLYKEINPEEELPREGEIVNTSDKGRCTFSDGEWSQVDENCFATNDEPEYWLKPIKENDYLMEILNQRLGEVQNNADKAKDNTIKNFWLEDVEALKKVIASFTELETN